VSFGSPQDENKNLQIAATVASLSDFQVRIRKRQCSLQQPGFASLATGQESEQGLPDYQLLPAAVPPINTTKNNLDGATRA
jgi:hypothetical protein